MVGINKIILEHFSDPNNPKELEEILTSFLEIESSDSMKKTGVDKLYDIISLLIDTRYINEII